MSNKLENLIKRIVTEELGGLTGNFFFGKDRSGGDQNPPVWQKTQEEYDALLEEFKSIMPKIQTQTEYKMALTLARRMGPSKIGASFKVYNILWPILTREGWTAEEDNEAAARAVFHALHEK
jgi:hypothetical protein